MNRSFSIVGRCPTPKWNVARRFNVSVRHRLPGGWLQSIQDRLQGPQVPVAHNFRNDFSISRNAAADHRAAMPGCYRQTGRVRSRTPECGLSTMLLVARHRHNNVGTSRRLMVKQTMAFLEVDPKDWTVLAA